MTVKVHLLRVDVAQEALEATGLPPRSIEGGFARGGYVQRRLYARPALRLGLTLVNVMRVLSR